MRKNLVWLVLIVTILLTACAGQKVTAPNMLEVKNIVYNIYGCFQLAMSIQSLTSLWPNAEFILEGQPAKNLVITYNGNTYLKANYNSITAGTKEIESIDDIRNIFDSIFTPEFAYENFYRQMFYSDRPHYKEFNGVLYVLFASGINRWPWTNENIFILDVQDNMFIAQVGLDDIAAYIWEYNYLEMEFVKWDGIWLINNISPLIY